MNTSRHTICEVSARTPEELFMSARRITAGLCIAATLALGQRVAAQQRPALQVKPTFTLLNATGDSVRVEVRSGNATTCAGNKPVGTVALGNRTSWVMRADSPICYRVQTDLSQGPSTWSAWNRRAPVRLVPAADTLT